MQMAQQTKTIYPVLVLLVLVSLAGCQKEDKEVEAKIGKAIQYWVYDSTGKKLVKATQLSVTFDRAFVCNAIPWDWVQQEHKGQKYLIVYARVENKGPRGVLWPSVSDVKVKVENGNSYQTDLKCFGGIGQRAPRSLDQAREWKLVPLGVLMGGLAQGDSLWWVFFTKIPDEATPLELIGVLDQCPRDPLAVIVTPQQRADGRTLKFRFSLPRDLTPSAFD